MKLFATLLLSTFIGTFAFAQDWSSDVYKFREQYPGYVITASGEKIEGYIEYSDCYTLQKNIVFYAEKGNKKTKVKYSAEDLLEYKMADKVWHVIHYSGGLMKKPLRGNLLVNTGCIAEYRWYEQAENFSSIRKQDGESDAEYHARLYPSTVLYLKKGDEYPVSLDYFAFSFAKKMAEYVSDQPELSAKVANKEKGYGMISLLDIIAEYNKNCQE